MSVLKNTSTDIPRQRLPREEKDFEWQKKNIDAFYDISYFSQIPRGGTSYDLVEKAYDLYNGVIDEDDYTHVLKPYGKKRQNFPAELHNYPILRPIVDLLLGEKRKRPMNYSVVVENDDIVSRKSEEKRKEVMRAIKQRFQDELRKRDVLPGESRQNQPERKDPPRPKEVAEEFEENYRDERAIQGQKALNIIQQENEVERKFLEGWKDWLIAGKVGSLRDIIGGELKYEILNPLHLDYDKSPEVEFIEDGDWAVIRKYAQPSEVVDEYYDVLTPEQIDQIENPELDRSGDYLIYDDLYNDEHEDEHTTRLVEVVQCYWKSRKKIGIVEYIDQFGQIQKKQVEEDYKLQQNDLTVEWHWINEVWKGTRIDEDIYVDIQPHPVQRRDMDNPSKCKLPINGRKYSDRNSPNVSLMILGYPYQLMYNIFKYRLENEIAKSKGVIAQLDVNMIPDGWDMDKYMYYIDATGIAWQDFQKEGIQPNPHQQQVMDLTMETATQYIELLEYTKKEVYDLIGINPQRQGKTGQYEKVENVENAIQQSTSMTEDMFAKFAEFEERELQGLLDYSKWAWVNGKSSNFKMSDKSEEIVDIDGYEHAESNYGVYVSDARQDVINLRKVKELGQAMLQNDAATPADIAEILDSQSMSSVKEKLRDAEERRNKLIQARQRAEKAQQEAKRNLEQQKIESEILQTRLDNQADLEEAKIKQGTEIEKMLEEKEITREELEQEKREMESDEKIAKMQQKKEAGAREE